MRPSIAVSTPSLNNESALLMKYPTFFPHLLGLCNDKCISCHALHWIQERTVDNLDRTSALYTSCCQKGYVDPPVSLQDQVYPAELKLFFEGNSPACKNFQQHIRNYNNSLSFASLGAKIDRTVQGQRGTYTFRISGTLTHDIGALWPNHGARPSFSQIFLVGDNDLDEVHSRISRSCTSLNPTTLLTFQNYLTHHNPYAQAYRQAKDLVSPSSTQSMVLRSVPIGTRNPKTYNQPTVDEIAYVIDDHENVLNPRDVVLHKTGGGLLHITDVHSAYFPLRYSILFPWGEQGWVQNYASLHGRRINVSRLEWYTYYLFD